MTDSPVSPSGAAGALAPSCMAPRRSPCGPGLVAAPRGFRVAPFPPAGGASGTAGMARDKIEGEGAAPAFKTWGEGRDSNPRPPGPQPGALPAELPPPRILLARLGGLEPPTCGLEVRCSVRLSYRRVHMLNYSTRRSRIKRAPRACRPPLRAHHRREPSRRHARLEQDVFPPLLSRAAVCHAPVRVVAYLAFFKRRQACESGGTGRRAGLRIRW